MDYLLREEALSRMGKIGPEAKEAIPLLVGILKDPKDSSLAPAAVKALAASWPPGEGGHPSPARHRQGFE